MPAAARERLVPLLAAPEDAAGRRALHRAVLAASLDDPGDMFVTRRASGSGTAGENGREACATEALPDKASDIASASFTAGREAAASLAPLARTRDDFVLLGWHHLRGEQFREAAGWFGKALAEEDATAGDDAAAGEADARMGHALALLGAGDKSAAQATLLPVADEDAALGCLYLDMATADLADGTLEDASHLQRLAGVLRSADAAQVIGWHHLDAGRPGLAREWFARSLEWRPSEPAATGLAVSADRLGRSAEARRIAERWSGEYPQLATFAEALARTAPPLPPARPVAAEPMRIAPDPAEALLRQALDAYERGEYDRAVTLLDERRELAGEPRDLALLRGWALHNAGRPRLALALFRSIDEAHSTPRSREGIRHSWRRLMPQKFH
jgi:tetratricopeptide (TPR) repeat protein